jgi:phosphoglycerol transferase MdoB-like AlkP superfamily enzyme
MDRAYAVGFRTEQGLAGIYSGALTTPYYNLTDNLSISKSMPSILQQAKKEGYYNIFLFGGDIEFAKMKSYLYFQKVDQIIDINNFSYSQKTQKMGVEDSIFFKEIMSPIQNLKEPFWVNVLTTSTHEPFDIEVTRDAKDEHDRYLRSASYLDRALRRFIGAYANSPKFKNTIFVITSDHSSEHPFDPPIRSSSRYHIPFIVYSPLLKSYYKGFRDSALYSQCDFSATFSKQFGLKRTQAMPYSRDHFSVKNHFTFSSFVNGFLYQTDRGTYPFDYIWDNDILKVDSSKPAYHESLAIMQHLIHFYKSN